jgi:hypothetical protein
MKKKIFTAITIMILTILFVYMVMFIDTNSLLDETKNVFCGKVEASDIEDMPVSRYNVTDSNQDAVVKLELHRLFTLHNFNDGYIWMNYSCEATSVQGDIDYGADNIYSVWKIHKEKGKWKIVEIIEDP